MKKLSTLLVLIFSTLVFSSVDYTITFKNGTDYQKLSVMRSVELAHKKLESPEFKTAVVSYVRPDGTGSFYQTERNNVDVYDKLVGSKWNYEVSFYSNCFSVANAYTIPGDPTVHLNWCKMAKFGDASIANTLVHEYTHVLGFTHDYQVTPLRPYSVPYAVGDIVGTLISGKKVESNYVPWYKKIARWFL